MILLLPSTEETKPLEEVKYMHLMNRVNDHQSVHKNLKITEIKRFFLNPLKTAAEEQVTKNLPKQLWIQQIIKN